MKTLLVVGGGAYQAPAIQRAREMGHTVLCVDRDPNAPGFAVASEYRQIDVLDREACLAYAVEKHIDGVMTYGATLPQPTVTYIAEQLHLPALPMETAELSRDKYQLKKRLAEHGCNVYGEFFELTSPAEAEEHTFIYPCVVKPCDGSGSKGVSMVYTPDELEQALDYAFSAARYGRVYVEGLIPGKEYCIDAFVDNGTPYVNVVIKTTFERSADGELHYGHRTPTGLPDEVEEAIAAEACRAIAALNVTMATVNFDIILCEADGKPYIIDCGIRATQNLISSHIVPYSRGVNVLDNTIHLVLGEAADAAPKMKRCIATRLLVYAPGVITEIRDMSALIGTDGIVDIVMRKHVGDRQNEYRDKSDTCGWVIAEGATPDEAECRADRARERLKDYIILSKE